MPANDPSAPSVIRWARFLGPKIFRLTARARQAKNIIHWALRRPRPAPKVSDLWTRSQFQTRLDNRLGALHFPDAKSWERISTMITGET